MKTPYSSQVSACIIAFQARIETYRGDRLFIGKLQGFDASKNLVHVATDACRIVQTQHELVLRVDDEDSANGQRQILLILVSGIDHAVHFRNFPVRVSDNGKLDFDFVLAVRHDVVQPLRVGLDGVNRQGRDEAVHRREFFVLQGQSTNFCRADGCEVGGVGEQDGPLTLLPLVEAFPVPMGRLGRKVGHNVPQTNA